MYTPPSNSNQPHARHGVPVHAPPTQYQEYIRSYISALDRAMAARREHRPQQILPPLMPQDSHKFPERSSEAARQRFFSRRAVALRSRELLWILPVLVITVAFIDDWQKRMIAVRTRRKIVSSVKS